MKYVKLFLNLFFLVGPENIELAYKAYIIFSLHCNGSRKWNFKTFIMTLIQIFLYKFLHEIYSCFNV